MGLAVVTAFAIADREPLVSLITLVGGLIGLVVLGGLTLLLTVILPLGIFLEFAINLLRRELSPGLAFEEKPTDTGPARPVDDERSKVRG